ncbi:hypothetical protein CROQUDRAFT_382728 [Cronartium quercuum f. sp. fusiforme G11]|uniref:Uncharacterized protein n=1 Tax=Cronartium quercuum f. sp. fusiforme G11 TaxID=708437 RepID=A0A9P6N621_9BASI|nr:hypothetical protein CROQUDRAFT_382728 [Cronartium quercuum f. sp. fusiforme G11]
MCTSEDYQIKVGSCYYKTCSPTDLTSGINTSSNACASVGHPLNITAITTAVMSGSFNNSNGGNEVNSNITSGTNSNSVFTSTSSMIASTEASSEASSQVQYLSDYLSVATFYTFVYLLSSQVD